MASLQVGNRHDRGWSSLLFGQREPAALPCVKTHAGRPDGVFGRDNVPMMWETAPIGVDEVTWFDFKYIRERQGHGLERPAVFDLDGLREVCALYREKTGRTLRL